MVKTKNSKKILYAFYLLQPLVQFLGLLALITFLSRCSPLSASTPKTTASPSLSSQVNQASNDSNVNKVLVDDQIAKSLKDLGTSEGKIVADSDMLHLVSNAISSDAPINEATVSAKFAQKLQSDDPLAPLTSNPIISITLSKDQLNTLLQTGDLRVDLAQHLAANDKAAQKLLFNNLQQSLTQQFSLNAESFVVLPASKMFAEYSNIALPLDISLAITGDNSGALQLHRENSQLSSENAALFDSAMRDAKQLVIVLE